jgi:hypothetical protein
LSFGTIGLDDVATTDRVKAASRIMMIRSVAAPARSGHK